MKLSAQKFADHIADIQQSNQLASCYLISGDEVLLVDEAISSIRQQAKASGIEEIERHTVLTGFDWAGLINQSANLSLFGGAKLVEVNLPTGKPGKVGAEALKRIIEEQLVDCLVVRSAKLDRSAARSAWAKAFEKNGVFVEFWPLKSNQWPSWVKARLQQAGFKAAPEAIRLLVDRVEGNLLAAHQEIIKLGLLYESGELSLEQVQKAVTNSSRFDVFALADVMLTGDFRKALKVLATLRDEGVESVIVLWALLREWRVVEQWLWRAKLGEPAADIAKSLGVWPQRRPLFNAAVDRIRRQAKQQGIVATTIVSDATLLANDVDMTVKGFRSGRAWSALQELLAAMCGEASLMAKYANRARFSGLAA